MLWRVKKHRLFGHVYHLQKNNTQLIAWSFLMTQSVSFTSQRLKLSFLVDECRGYCRGIYTFLVSALAKKNAEAIKFLGILKKYVSKNEIYFYLKKKSNILFNKKDIFVFHTVFKLVFITQIIYCTIHRCRCPLFILFLFSYQFLKSATKKQC